MMMKGAFFAGLVFCSMIQAGEGWDLDPTAEEFVPRALSNQGHTFREYIKKICKTPDKKALLKRGEALLIMRGEENREGSRVALCRRVKDTILVKIRPSLGDFSSDDISDAWRQQIRQGHY